MRLHDVFCVALFMSHEISKVVATIPARNATAEDRRASTSTGADFQFNLHAGTH